MTNSEKQFLRAMAKQCGGLPLTQAREEAAKFREVLTTEEQKAEFDRYTKLWHCDGF